MDGAPGGADGSGRDGERDEREPGARGGFALWEGVAVREGVERSCAERVEDWWERWRLCVCEVKISRLREWTWVWRKGGSGISEGCGRF